MSEIRLAVVEYAFAEIVWEHAPLTTRELVKLCEKALNWKRTTTYTVLKKLCNRGILAMQDSVVTVLISKAEFHAIQSTEFVQDHFSGSLPAFLAAFASHKAPTQAELDEIKKLIDSFEVSQK